MIFREPEVRRIDVRLSFLPLARTIAGDRPLLHEHPDRVHEVANSYVDAHYYMSDVALAEQLGVHVRQVQRWWHGISVESAEDVCDRLGLHPVWIWDDYHRLIQDTAVLLYEDDELWDPITERQEKQLMRRARDRRIKRAKRREASDDRAGAEGAVA